MPGRLNTQLKQLEDSHGQECPECGFDGDLSNVQIEVVWEDLDEDKPEELEDDPEYCPECGHQLIYTVTWMDLEEGN